VLAHRPDPDDASTQIDLIGVPWMIVSQEPSAVPNGGTARVLFNAPASLNVMLQ
jgi:hypothetical protein